MRDQRTKYIEHLIEKEWPNMKAFSESIDIPYTTLRSMLQRGIGNASVNNVIKVCRGLGITTDELIEWGSLFGIGWTIKEERIKQGLTIEDLSQLTNIDSQLLQQLEEGTLPVTSEKLEIITDTFKMTVSEFLIKYEMYDEAELHYFYKDSSETEIDSKREKQIQTIAAHMDDDLSEDEIEDIKEYIQFIKSKRK